MPDRLVTIEIKLAHLERSLQELGETVLHQQGEIEAFRMRNRALKAQLDTLEVGAGSVVSFEKPPHY